MRNGQHRKVTIELRQKSKRAKLLTLIAANQNKLIPATMLAKKIYGSPKRVAPLHMVAIGLSDRLRLERTGWLLKHQKKEGKVVYGLFRR